MEKKKINHGYALPCIIQIISIDLELKHFCYHAGCE